MGKAYANLDPHMPIGKGLLRWRLEKYLAGVPQPPPGGYQAFAERWCVQPDFVPGTGPRTWWLGHATVLLRLGGLHLITDPHLSERASPFSFMGPKRLVPAPAQAGRLPKVDVVLISHNHYDHLDDRSIRALHQANPDLVCYAPKGLKPWFERRGIRHVHELGWWEKHGHQDLEIHCVPAQHWSARTPFDRNRTLWCGWVVKGAGLSFYFSGDTGYTPRLQEIASRLGPPDLAALPIGSYAPRWFMRPQHVDPPEAVRLHRELGVRRSLAIHWGTFELADDGLEEPVDLLQQALRESDLGADDFWVIRQGESRGLELP
ncbi:MAG TPA: MBL fold metallo-hydrolase [Gammaproteobacteria bacterium]|nr:MBL fold metallo-hydrolase [Gammaproteobacteria bacterium]